MTPKTVRCSPSQTDRYGFCISLCWNRFELTIKNPKTYQAQLSLAEYLSGRSMRIALLIAIMLSLLTTFWCTAGYFFAPAQAGETEAKLSPQSIRGGFCDRAGIRHYSSLAGTSTVLMVTAFVLSSCRRSHEHPTA
jgi:hypothetical protein